MNDNFVYKMKLNNYNLKYINSSTNSFFIKNKTQK